MSLDSEWEVYESFDQKSSFKKLIIDHGLSS